jgi:hypothetical protein
MPKKYSFKEVYDKLNPVMNYGMITREIDEA